MAKWHDNARGASDVGEYRDILPDGLKKGRGAGLNPGNRFETVRLHVLGEYLDAEHAAAPDSDAPPNPTGTATIVYRDHTKSLINHVNHPDIHFNWTINPYRGCEHGCIYCYARPDHERLGFSSGLDFETRIIAKPDAPKLLRDELASPKWKGEMIQVCGDTDCYQPLEAKMKITRGCLEVFAECRQPICIITKNRLVTRDIDLLGELAKHGAVRVAISVTSLDRSLSMKMEPRASSPADRLRAIRELTDAGIPTMVMVAPIVPGLTDKEVPNILKAVAEAGALNAGYVLLRLPHQIKALFIEWAQRHFPDRAKHIETLIRDMRGGELYQSKWGERQKGTGPMAEQIANVFKVFVKRYGLDKPMPPMSKDSFRPPLVGNDGQMGLFA